MKVDISKIGTEQQNVNTMNIDRLDTLSMVQLINREDQAVIDAVSEASEQIANAVDAIYETIHNGGRLVYIGAGTSGRLGVLDASEVLPTYGVGEEAVIGLIAGGDRALRHPVENAEDSTTMIVDDLKNINFNEKDILCAIASSGRTPYCIGGIHYAKSLGAQTVSIACVADSEVGKLVDYPIEAVVGQEVVTGSTRMKSGSATKMILNILSTTTMIKMGKVYGNLMVDVRTSNEKLIERAKTIIIRATGVAYDVAEDVLEKSNNHVKTAIVMIKTDSNYEEAKTLLANNDDRIADAVDAYENQ
ncbi:N-acetylmuramic acid 6-phosphate etherase [Erysipelothrix sp. HDW6A]|uniref:N-acetylmuramic acid 6-phosphate etherase n=1 Tax=Erysipelothrix sp. HDW6A TaxID=2714928 RepID=UPI00140B9390|nr:N-acetylmuramic acid 6-phosphate etherase [Erysipelothrix sp. HDW6A]QIK57531.1 N-acetylmuramic acid 6-phosphate etherase [Erysipelothrix sp. HDW6A]